MAKKNEEIPLPPAPPEVSDGLTDEERAQAEAEIAEEKARLAKVKAAAEKEKAKKPQMTVEQIKKIDKPFKVKAIQEGILKGQRIKPGDEFVIPHGGKFGAWMEKV